MDRTVAKGETAVLQCIAGGSPPPKLNWTKDDSPLVVTERHFFAAANQLLIIVDTAEADAGTYTCEMSNALGTERGNIRLSVMPNPNCDSGAQGGTGLGAVGSAGSDSDGWTTVGIVIIAVVCCVVGTSLVWVVIIYHTRRRTEDCSVTNTGKLEAGIHHLAAFAFQMQLHFKFDAYLFQMRPTCLPTYPVTYPPKEPWLTARTDTSHQKAAAISTWPRPSVASTCSLKT